MAVGSPIRALLVEDNPFDVELITHALKASGLSLEIAHAEDEQGFVASLTPRPDIVLIDYNLPSFDVFAAMDIARRHGGDFPFIVVTGYAGDEVAAECIKRGAADYVLKDQLRRLPQAVTLALEQRELRETARRAERDIFASEALKSAILESALDCVVGMSDEGKIIEFNPAAEATFGYTRDEAMGQSVAELMIPPAYRSLHEKGLAAFRATGEGRVMGRRIEIEAMRKGGSVFPAELAITQVNLPGAQVFTAVIRDISPRLEMERSLRESEVRFRSLVQNSRDVIAVVDENLDLRFVSPAVEEITGFSPEELLGTASVDYIHPGDVERLAHEVAEIMAEPNEAKTIEVRCRTKTGDFIWIEIRAANRLKDPGIRGIVLNYHDITERRLALNELQRSQKSMADAQAIAHLGSFEWDPEAGLLTWSDEQFRIFGHEPQAFAVAGSHFIDAVHPDDRQQVLRGNEMCARTGGPVEREFRIRRPDGSERWLRGCTSAVLQDGRLIRLFGSNQDVTEQREAEEDRRRLVERQRDLAEQSRLLLESTGEGMWGQDQEGRCTFVNQAAAHALGYEVDDLLGQVIHHITHHSKADGSPYPVEECPTSLAMKEGRATHRGAEVFWKADGTSIPVEYSAYPIFRDGQPSGAVVSFKDVSDRIRMEEALRSSEALFRGAFRAAQTGIALIDADSRAYVDVNQSLCDMLGYTKEELLELDWVTITHPDDRSVNLERVRCLSTGQDDFAFFTKRYVRKDGSVIIVEISDAVLRDADGAVQYFVAHVVDVTEKRAADRHLQESRELLEAVLDNSPAVIYIKRLNGDYMLINRQYQEILDVTVEGVIGRNDVHLHGPEIGEILRANDRQIIAGGVPRELEEVVQHSDGTMHTYISLKFPLFDTDGEPYAMCGISTDISERVKAEENRMELEGQLRQALKMEAVGQLAGGVAHDFNNILAVILNYAAFVAEDLPAGDPRAEDVGEIVKAGQKATKLVHQLLAFSRKEVIEEQVVDLNDVVADLGELLRRSIGEDIQLDTVLEEGLWPTKADPGQLEQVLMNLAVNGRDAMPGGGSLTVTTSNQDVAGGELPGLVGGKYVTLRVSDTGVGMDADATDRIFEPFFTTKPRGQGTGLGLATVYGIVKQAQGGIYVGSEIGVGTSFTVYLPVCDEPHQPPLELPQPKGLPAGQETIVVVEDDDAVRHLVSRILEKSGFEVVAKSSGRDAVAYFERTGAAVDLVLTDVVMPEMSGKVLADNIRSIDPNVKVLFMSGYTDEIIAKRGILESGRQLINKPFDGAQLVSRVREILGERKVS
jgi:PAS domain S-box-containing protein